jgi:hypothetical protein
MKIKPSKFNPDSQWLDTQLNNRVCVPEFAQHIQHWQASSANARLKCVAQIISVFWKRSARRATACIV